ncbi:DoxX family protein [Subtercola boreus]|uniref:DoxX family protein n=1 Tax=Subtercola boreus TaxID=120213 RepID=A0A3E0WG80_9MICO|nr:DoxX family protein [Subtercola boreus]RFA22705.1 hypothetical protein B7R24_03595 [Subtercola boreus]RFA23060.1 hypothetical protein B7R23_03590 [Subtercola boreus]RFA28813.1 hypothetical protein B7R25_03605 [Subtercola boreus]
MNPETPHVIHAAVTVALAALFVFMGVNHFVPKSARTMAAMIPPSMRFTGILSPRTLVFLTGLCEVAGGVGLLVPALRLAAAFALAVFLVAVFPANAYAAGKRERFGAVAVPLVPRTVGQLVLIALLLFVARG